jgi:hypothetical protein
LDSLRQQPHLKDPVSPLSAAATERGAAPLAPSSPSSFSPPLFPSHTSLSSPGPSVSPDRPQNAAPIDEGSAVRATIVAAALNLLGSHAIFGRNW